MRLLFDAPLSLALDALVIVCLLAAALPAGLLLAIGACAHALMAPCD